MRIIVQGAGVVGAVTKEILEQAGHQVAVHDPALGLEASGKAEALVVCTPCLRGLLDPLPDVECRHVVVRSTVFPAAFDELPAGRRHHWPEFLTERTAAEDARHPDKLVWGSDEPIRGQIFARALLGDHFKSAPFIWMPLRASCLTKIAINTIYAAKVVMANAVYEALDGDEGDYLFVLRGLAADQRINLTHTQIWQDGFRGAGGKCLPKDSRFMAELLGPRTTGMFVRALVETNRQLMMTGS